MSGNRHQEYLSKLPNDWKQVSIEELGTIYAGGTPSRLEPSFWNGSIAWVTPGELTGLDSKWLTETKEYITEAGLFGSSAHLMPKGTLLVTTRASIGAIAVAAIPVCTNQGFKSIVPNEFTNSDFYYHLLQRVAPELSRLSSGSTFDEISRRCFAAIVVPRPSRDEQRRIAEILDTVDDAIAHTSSLIAKLKQMKAGLLHDLLTRGLDENGELRDAIAHPELFKDSPLGRIPKEWEVGKLCDFYALPARNGLYKPANFYGRGVLMIHMPQMFRGLTIDISDAVRVDVSHSELERFELKPGDLVFARRSLNLEGAGRCSLVPGLPEKTTFESSIIRVRLSTEKLRPVFANYFLNSEAGFRLRLPLIRQVAVSGVSSEDIASIPVPCPLPEEQDAIVEIIKTQDIRICTEEVYRDKLKLQKQGLMQDLLTGRVRVEVKNFK